jgi:hypothetical protein
MSAKTLTHIVPALRPQNNSAGDYALNLALELRKSYGVQSQFIVCDPERSGNGRVEDFVVQRLRVRNEAGIWSLLASVKNQRPPVLLHYCAYGYHKQGVPHWLYQGIKSWLDEYNGADAGSEKQLMTVFHETFPETSKPWKKEFYLRIPQQRLLQKFHRRSKLSVTGSRNLQALLDSVEPHKSVLSPTSGSASFRNEQTPDWKSIARQYQAELFPQLVNAKAGVKPDKAAVEEVKERMAPANALDFRAVESSTRIRPRLA